MATMPEAASDKEYLLWLHERISSEKPLKGPGGAWRFDLDRLKDIAETLPEGSPPAPMSTFEVEVKKAAEKAVLKLISEGNWLSHDYNSRFRVPAEWMQRCWELVDKDKLQGHFARRLEEELANRMVNHMATEIATDVKQILSDKERRESLRALAREHMNALMGDKTKGK